MPVVARISLKIAVGLLTICVAASAGVVNLTNGDIETGDLTGWTDASGNVTAAYATALGVTLPYAALNYADVFLLEYQTNVNANGVYGGVLTANQDGIDSGDLSTFAGSTVGTGAGAAIQQAFSALAGDYLRLDMVFLSGIFHTGNPNDFAFWALSGAETVYQVLASRAVVGSGAVVNVPINYQLAGGNYTLTLGVVTPNTTLDSEHAASVLLVDAYATPEPSTIYLLAAGISMLGLAVRRQRRR